jgi:hypothetical protein
VWSGSFWQRIQFSGGLLWTQQYNLSLYKLIPRPAEEVLTSQTALCSMESVTFDTLIFFTFNTTLTINCIVCIVARLQTGWHSVGLWQELVICVFFKSPRLTLGSAGLSLRVKWQRQERNHSSPSSTEVNYEWSCTSAPPHAFMACTGTSLPFLIIN